MRKLSLLFVAAIMTANVMAQHEIGAVVGGLNGASYKYWFSDNLALQADLAVGLTETVARDRFYGEWVGNPINWDVYDFTLNPNVLYHFALPADFKIYVGGGANIGLMGGLNQTYATNNPVLGKFGLNAMVGACYCFTGAPVAIALDFRPGYGLSFDSSDRNWACHMFDWKLAFAVRYCL